MNNIYIPLIIKQQAGRGVNMKRPHRVDKLDPQGKPLCYSGRQSLNADGFQVMASVFRELSLVDNNYFAVLDLPLHPIENGSGIWGFMSLNRSVLVFRAAPQGGEVGALLAKGDSPDSLTILDSQYSGLSFRHDSRNFRYLVEIGYSARNIPLLNKFVPLEKARQFVGLWKIYDGTLQINHLLAVCSREDFMDVSSPPRRTTGSLLEYAGVGR